MLRTCLIALLLALSAPAAGAQTIVLVRHAERADAGTAAAKVPGADPELAPAGQSRAKRLADVLRDAKITAIYATEYKRTQQTAAPLAQALGIEISTLPSKDVKGLVEKLSASPGHALVVGHSNSVPEILKALGVQEPVIIDESDFGNLFVLTPGSPRSLLRLRY
jgi:phosphohistidine phosphatase SixA